MLSTVFLKSASVGVILDQSCAAGITFALVKANWLFLLNNEQMLGKIFPLPLIS